MDKSVLLKISQEVLVIPFEDDIAGSLDEFCHNQIMGIDYERIAELIFCCILRKRDEKTERELVKYMEDKQIGENVSPQVIMPVLIEYIVLLAIDEAPNAGQKAIFSLMLRNAMLGVNKGIGRVMSPDVITPTFDLYRHYLDVEKTFKEDDVREPISYVLDAPPEAVQFTFKSDENKTKIKSLMYDAANYRYRDFIENFEISEENAIIKAYRIAEKLVNESPWMYVDKHPARTIKELFRKFGLNESAVEIENIINELRSLYEGEESIFNTTSILLSIANGKEDLCKISYNGNKIDLIDFAVYVYYELQAERMMKENKIKKEEKSNGE